MAQLLRWLTARIRQNQSASSIPEGRCVYAVGDIHGRADLTQSLLERIWADAPASGNTLIFLGDYVDRGPDSRIVLNMLRALSRPGWDFVMLRGNHEQLLLNFLTNPESFLAWRNFGGAETLLSYGVRPPMFSGPKEMQDARDAFLASLPTEHRDFLMGLRYCHSIGDYFFVHAGVRPSIPLDRQSEEDLLWIREDFLTSDQKLEKVVVHGHTPGERPVVRHNRICVDTGAYATNCLTAAKLSRESCIFISTGEL